MPRPACALLLLQIHSDKKSLNFTYFYVLWLPCVCGNDECIILFCVYVKVMDACFMCFMDVLCLRAVLHVVQWHFVSGLPNAVTSLAVVT